MPASPATARDPEMVARTHARRDRVLAFLRNVPGVVAGRLPDEFGIARPAKAYAARRLMELCREDYLTKAEGQPGDDGERWPPLSRYTLHQRRWKNRARGGKGDFRILIDEGNLLEACGPGEVSGGGLGTSYQPPAGQKADLDVPGALEISVTLDYAARHMGSGFGSDLGSPVPKRAPLPEEVPDAWLEEVAEAFGIGLAEGIADAIGRLR
jgi:hypothetical protein